MEAKSLMIGDWVYYINIPIKIEQIIPTTGGEDMKPIPLTPEIIYKNEYEPNDYGDWIVNKNDYFIGWSMIRKTARIIVYSTIECVQQDAFVSCQYVHELQHALRLCGLDKLADNLKLN